jgi:hypothetical protein
LANLIEFARTPTAAIIRLESSGHLHMNYVDQLSSAWVCSFSPRPTRISQPTIFTKNDAFGEAIRASSDRVSKGVHLRVQKLQKPHFHHSGKFCTKSAHLTNFRTINYKQTSNRSPLYQTLIKMSNISGLRRRLAPGQSFHHYVAVENR